MNGKLLVALLVLATCAMVVYATNPQTATVNYVVAASVDFSITYPAGTVSVTFDVTTPTVGGLNATNQTTTVPILKFQNTGNINTYYDLNLTAANPSWAVLQCGPAFGSYQVTGCDCQGAGTATATTCCNITSSVSSYSRINATITAVSAYQNVWCWGNFTSAVAGTTSRTMSINSSAS